MPASFPRDLRQFLRSVDVVDQALLEDVIERIAAFIKSNETIHYAEVMEVVPRADVLALRTLWRAFRGDDLSSQMEAQYDRTLLGEDGSYGSNAAQSVHGRRRQWLVAAPGETLESEATAVDEWPDPTVVPVGTYNTPTGDDDQPLAKFATSVVLPLYLDGRVIGVLDLESCDRIEPVQSARDEVTALADAIGTLVGMKRTSEHPLKLRRKALDEITQRSSFRQGIALTKPTLFFAWPNSASQDMEHGKQVIEIVRQVVRSEYESTIRLLDWEEVHQPGHILDQVFGEIRGSSYGVCYLSESDPHEPGRYVDNPNVLFEAGMLHSQAGNRWIPIRERKDLCATPPFDLAQLRHLEVPRGDDGRLDAADFEQTLTTMLSELFRAELT